MKKIILIMVIVLTLFGNVSVYAEAPKYPDDRGIILYEMNSDQIIASQNIDKKMYPASTTKIMTAILVVENLSLDEKLVVGDEISIIPSYSSNIDLVQGEEFKVEDLLYALLLPSANDAANVLAVNVAKKVSGNYDMDTQEAIAYFSNLMNDKAEHMGAYNCNFENPHGLNNNNHYVTVGDMLIITKEFLKHDELKNIVKTTEHHVTTNVQSHDLFSTNAFLQKSWDNIPHADRTGENIYYNTKVDGIKTGTTTPAGKCVIFSAHNGNLDLIGIVYHSTEDDLWQDGTDLMDYAFNNYEYVNLMEKGKEIKNIPINNSSTGDGLSVVAGKDQSMLVEKKSDDIIESNISYIDKISNSNDTYEINGDIHKDDKIGEIEYSVKGEIITTTDVYAGNSIKMLRLYHILLRWYNVVIIIFLLLMLRIIWVQIKKARKRKKRGNIRRRHTNE